MVFNDLLWWQYALVALAMTHLTTMSVTLFLHRSQTHRALTLHPLVSHPLRFWLWFTTGMETKEWVAVHRKHHDTVETAEDPHSPVWYGLPRVFFLGVPLYHREATNPATLEKYGYGTPNDWLERNLYTRHSLLGIALLLGLDLLLFGFLAGFVIWVVQIVWVPIWAAGVINGVGHAWGYRNYPTEDNSHNILPVGAVMGGEELHNNHHRYPWCAKFSRKRWEFDLGWLYVRILEFLRLATDVRYPLPGRG